MDIRYQHLYVRADEDDVSNVFRNFSETLESGKSRPQRVPTLPCREIILGSVRDTRE